MTTPVAGGEAFDAEGVPGEAPGLTAEQEAARDYLLALADDAERAVVNIEISIEGMRATLDTRRAELADYRAQLAQIGA